MKKLFLILLTISHLINAQTGTSYTTDDQRFADGLTQTLKPLEKDPRIGVFGDLITADRNDLINLQFQYGTVPPTDFTTTSITGSGSVTSSSSMAVIASGNTNPSIATLQTKRNLIYYPGHDAYAFFTALFTTGAASGSYQLIGLFDDTDGFAIGYHQNNSSTFSILHRNNGSDTVILQDDFNIDKLDGTGQSGILLDPTKINIFRIAYGWLGTACVTFEISRQDGIWFPFHRLKLPNTLTLPSVTNPTLPMRAQVQGVGSPGVTLKTASWCAGVVGNRTANYIRNFSATTGVTKSIGTTEVPILSIRSTSPNFQGKPNRVEVHLVFASLSTDARAVRFRLRKNPTLTGASYSSVDTNSSVEFDINATTTSGGSAVFASIVGISNVGGNLNLFFDKNSYDIMLLSGDVLTVTAQTLSANSNVDVTLSWEEDF